jgi:hypothetical protein
MSDLEAVGDAVTGGVVGRAVEPKAGEGSDGHTHEGHCLNCGAELRGAYCHQCGQHAHVHRTLAAFFHDFAHGVLHFEGKIWRTLPLLAWKPGALTRRYIDGERANFLSPVALFLFSVFLMFGVLSATGNVNPHLGSDPDLAKAEQTSAAKIQKLQAKRSRPGLDAGDIKDIDENIASERSDLALIRDLRAHGVMQATFSRGDEHFNSNVPWIEKAYHKAKQNPDLLLYKLKSNSYKWSWALIPLSVPFVWLLFPFSRRFRIYDHVVFVTYSLCFMTLLVTVGAIFGVVGLGAVALPMLLIPPVHIYRQLRGTYAVGPFGATWRTLLLLLFGVFVLTGFILLMVTLGVSD